MGRGPHGPGDFSPSLFPNFNQFTVLSRNGSRKGGHSRKKHKKEKSPIHTQPNSDEPNLINPSSSSVSAALTAPASCPGARAVDEPVFPFINAAPPDAPASGPEVQANSVFPDSDSPPHFLRKRGGLELHDLPHVIQGNSEKHIFPHMSEENQTTFTQVGRSGRGTATPKPTLDLSSSSHETIRPKALDLFSGTGSVGNRLQELGFDVISLDIDPNRKPTIVSNVLDWDYTKDFSPGFFSVIAAGVPCNEYSSAKTIGRRRLDYADKLVQKTLDIINFFSHQFGGLRTQNWGCSKRVKLFVVSPTLM